MQQVWVGRSTDRLPLVAEAALTYYRSNCSGGLGGGGWGEGS